MKAWRRIPLPVPSHLRRRTHYSLFLLLITSRYMCKYMCKLCIIRPMAMSVCFFTEMMSKSDSRGENSLVFHVQKSIIQQIFVSNLAKGTIKRATLKGRTQKGDGLTKTTMTIRRQNKHRTWKSSTTYIDTTKCTWRQNNNAAGHKHKEHTRGGRDHHKFTSCWRPFQSTWKQTQNIRGAQEIEESYCVSQSHGLFSFYWVPMSWDK